MITGLIWLGLLHRLDKQVQDQLFQQPGVTYTDIIIGIDEEALDLFGPYNTWDRNIMAAALEALAADPSSLPAVVAVDVLYAGNTDEAADARLAQAAKALGNVVTGTMAVYGASITWDNGRAASINASAVVSYEEPFGTLKNATVQGRINAMNDMGGVLRHALLYVKPDRQRVDSMASQTARLYLQRQGKDLTLPDMPHLYVPYTGRPGDYSDGVSIAWLVSGKVPPGYWKDKIVLIGPYAAALQDSYFTSIDKSTPMYGVEFQANVIQSMLEGNFKTEAENLPQLMILFLISFAAAVLFLRCRLLPGWEFCTDAGLCQTAARGWLPVGQQEIHEHEASGGITRRCLCCRLTSFSQTANFLRIYLDTTLLYTLRSKLVHELYDPGTQIEFIEDKPTISHGTIDGQHVWTLNFPKQYIYELANETIRRYIDECETLPSHEPSLSWYRPVSK